MSEPKRPLKVFLCHAHDDKSKARDLYRYLRKRGIQPWLDAENLLAGQDWQVEIPNAIATSDAIIICLSKNSVDKEGYVQKEVKFALDRALEMPEGRIFLIPARLEECNLPSSLQRYHWVDLFETDGYTKLMRSLKTRAAQLQRAVVEVPKPDETNPNLPGKAKPSQAEPREQPKTPLPWGSMIMVAGILIGAVVIVAALIGFLQSFKPAPIATATGIATITDIITLTHVPTSTFTALPSSATRSWTAIVPTQTFAPALTPHLTITATSAPMSIQITIRNMTNGSEYTFHAENIPNECDQTICELRWTLWEGKWIKNTFIGGDFNIKHDTGWKKADSDGLIFVLDSGFIRGYGTPGPPFLINFQICTDPGIRERCKTVSSQISQ